MKKKTIKDFEKEQKKCLELVKVKNADYSNKHFLLNFDDFGYKGIIIRIGDKFSRLRTFYSKDWKGSFYNDKERKKYMEIISNKIKLWIEEQE